VKINGIRPHRFEGRGLGIIAERDFKVCWMFSALYLYVYLNIFRSCYQLPIRTFIMSFPCHLFSYVFMFCLVRSEFSQKSHFHSNNMIVFVKSSACSFLIRPISRSSLFPAHLLCKQFPEPLNFSAPPHLYTFLTPHSGRRNTFNRPSYRSPLRLYSS
jgi:hypothetical protein